MVGDAFDTLTVWPSRVDEVAIRPHRRKAAGSSCRFNSPVLGLSVHGASFVTCNQGNGDRPEPHFWDFPNFTLVWGYER